MLAWVAAGGAAVLATLFSRNEARAGHDGTNVLHLGEGNAAPPGTVTSIVGNGATGPILGLQNAFGPAATFHSDAEGLTLGLTNNNPAGYALEAVAFGGRAGVRGIASLPTGGFGAGAGNGVHGVSGTGAGVRGESQSGTGVTGSSATGTGGQFSSGSGNALSVLGRATMTADVAAVAGDTLFVENTQAGEGGGGAISAVAQGGGHAVEGIANGLGVGVRGVAGADPFGEGPGDGVHGSSGTGIGVLGHITGAGIGVEARSESPEGIALQVRGSARFSTAGSATILAGTDSAFVANPAVTEESHISVTFVSEPGSRQLTWVDRHPDTGFTVHTASQSKKAPETSLTYLVVEPYDA